MRYVLYRYAGPSVCDVCYIGMLVPVCALCVFLSCCMCYIGMLVPVCAVCVSDLLYVLYRYAGQSVCCMSYIGMLIPVCAVYAI